MWSIEGLIRIVALLAAMPAWAGGYAETFQRETGLRTGDYDLVSGDDNCLEGFVTVEDAGDQVVAVQIGARLFIDALGPKSNSRQEDDDPNCEYIRPALKDTSSPILASKKVTCQNVVKFDAQYKIQITRNGFVTNFRNGKHHEKCTYVRAKARRNGEDRG